MLDAQSVGERVASERKLAGLSQEQLAQRSNYSLSMVRKVERDVEPASPGFIAAVSRAMGIDPDRLTGVPYTETIEADGHLEGMADLRAILAEGPYVAPLPPSPLTEMQSELRAINRAYRDDKGRQALRLLPALIRQLHGALRESTSDGEKSQIHALLASAYVTAERLCRRFGFMTLTTPALDRLDNHSSLAADRLFVPQALIKRARVLMYFDSTEVGLSLVEQALNSIDSGSEPALAVRGYGHLCGAITAARGRKLDVAQEHIKEARQLARHVHGESDAYGTLFGAGNVEIHSCAVELEAGDPRKAAEVGSELQLPADIAPPRAGHHWQDTARAWLLSGEPHRALEALNKAREVAPQQTRLHPGVRVTLRQIANLEKRRTDSLSNFVSWVGLKV